MIQEFKVERMKSITRHGRVRKPASVNRELAILSGIFRMAVDYNEITDNPCRKVQKLPENNQRTRHLSFEEEDRLFEKLTGIGSISSRLLLWLSTQDHGAENC